MDYYEILGVERTATAEEIKKAYKRMVKKHHPDKAQDESERVERHKSMIAINQAYEALIDPAKRAHYDQFGSEKPRDTIEHQALQVIYSILQQFSEQAPDTFNFIQPMREQLQENKRQIKAGEEQLKKKIRKTEKQRKCIRRKAAKNGQTGENLLDRIFQQKIDHLNAKIAEIPEALKIADKAIEILLDYESAIELGTAPQLGGLAQLLGRY